MAMSRKGIVFTIVALLFVILITAIYGNTLILYDPFSNRASTTRIKVMNNYVKNFESYIEDSLEISTHHTLASLYNYSASAGSFFASESVFGAVFDSCMRCGYLDCSINTTLCPDLSGKNFDSMIANITDLTQKNLNIITEYNIINVTIHQDYPFDVEVESYVTYAVYDKQKSNYAVWNRTRKFTESVSIAGLYDPLVAVNTNNAFQREIVPTSICSQNESCWNESTFRQLYLSQEYRYYSNGTSYISRFINSSASSECCGLESFLNTSIASGFNSYVDNYYWNNIFLCVPSSSNFTILEINNTAPGFRLDESTAARYRLTSYGYEVCP